jgi:ADP-ribose pyrophosphatase
VSWPVEWPEYAPTVFTSQKLLDDKPSWADGDDPLVITNWNHLDGSIDRKSHLGDYEVIEGVPRNPVGRTGISGWYLFPGI